MNREIRDRWTARLRSGQDEQGSSVLRDRSDRKCCLGVLCEMAVEDGVIGQPTLAEWDEGYTYGNWDSYDKYYLPGAVAKWAELDYHPRVPFGSDGTQSLATLNDGDETTSIPAHSFGEIADLVEEHL